MSRELRTTERTIETDAHVAEAVAALVEACPHMALAVETCGGPPPLRRRPPGFDTLARILIGQQLSVASANAIWARVEAGLAEKTSGAVTAKKVRAASDDKLRSFGLSRPKARYLRAAADAVADGSLDLDGLAGLSDADAHAQLIAVTGIGPWTADIYLLSGLGRPDVFPAGDLALQGAAQRLMRKRKRPDAAALVRIAKRWQPWRGVAARVLWQYYSTPPL